MIKASLKFHTEAGGIIARDAYPLSASLVNLTYHRLMLDHFARRGGKKVSCPRVLSRMSRVEWASSDCHRA